MHSVWAECNALPAPQAGVVLKALMECSDKEIFDKARRHALTQRRMMRKH